MRNNHTSPTGVPCRLPTGRYALPVVRKHGFFGAIHRRLLDRLLSWARPGIASAARTLGVLGRQRPRNVHQDWHRRHSANETDRKRNRPRPLEPSALPAPKPVLRALAEVPKQ